MRSIEDIIVEKKYGELSPEELVMVSELAENEEEFNRMKQLFDNMSFGMDEAEVFEASPETKSSLDSIFAAKHPVIANDWKKEEETVEDAKVVAFYNRNWVRVAAILLIFLGISVVYIQNSEEITPEKESRQQAKAEVPLESSGKTSTKAIQSTDKKPIKQESKKEKVQLLAAVTPAESNTWTKSAASDKQTLSSGDVSQSMAEQQNINFGASAVIPSSTGAVTYSYSTSMGLNSDLYPDGKMSKDKDRKSSVTTDIPAPDMLDWIQAGY